MVGCVERTKRIGSSMGRVGTFKYMVVYIVCHGNHGVYLLSFSWLLVGKDKEVIVVILIRRRLRWQKFSKYTKIFISLGCGFVIASWREQ